MASCAILDLPLEILLMIRVYLSYPDLVFLRLTHPRLYFSEAFNTNNTNGLRSRIEWLQPELIYKSLGPAVDGPSLDLSFSAQDIGFWSFLNALQYQWLDDESIRFKTDAEFLTGAGHILKLRLRHRDCKSGETFKRCTGPHNMGRLLPKSNHIRRVPYYAVVRTARATARLYGSIKTTVTDIRWFDQVAEEPENEFRVLLDRVCH